MAAENKTKWELLLLNLLETNPNITILQVYSLIAKDKKLSKDLDTLKYANPTGLLRHEAKTKVLKLIQSLAKRNEVTITTDEDEQDFYSVSETGKQRIIQGISSKALVIQNKVKEGETEDGEDKKEKYIEWTNPIFVEKNNRWEFYQKQEGTILEILHSESEEEIRSMHKSKVMNHIMAAMHQPKPKGEQFIKRTLSEETIEENKDKSRMLKKDTSQHNSQEAKIKIMAMKLGGHSMTEIITVIKNEFGLKAMTVGLYISDVLDEIRKIAQTEIQETIQTHIDRYEELYLWFNDNGYSKAALKVLERKERLLGLHGGDEINNVILDNLGDKGLGKVRYNWFQLSEPERARLMQLARRTIVILNKNKGVEEVDEQASVSGSISTSLS